LRPILFSKLAVRCAAPLLTGLAALQPAHAVLTAYTANGVDLVHSSESNISYTATGNLLAQWNAQGRFDAAFNDILALTPTISVHNGVISTETRTLDSNDILASGRATFFGALAVVNYMNHIRYAGTDTWRLPLADNGKYPGGVLSSYVRTGELGQLYYDEWHCQSTNTSNCNLGPFTDVPFNQTWSQRNLVIDYGGGRFDTIVQPFYFHTGRGEQYNINPSFAFYFVAVAPGTVAQVSSVPEPQAAWLFAPGLALLAAWARRRR
jgi:MYXO-CTERM domain-containing protein